MRWRGGRRSRNIEDRRGQRVRGPLLGGGIGTIVVILVALYFGIDPTFLLEGMQSVESSTTAGSRPSADELRDDPVADMVAVVMADTEDVWNAVFAERGLDYTEPTLVLFSGMTRSACGLGQAAMGPFYCPADGQAYIDLAFFEDLGRRFGAPGDFAQAYVVAHEVGHHVQNLLGILAEVRRRQQALEPAAANRLSVRVELQADCLAGVWARRADRLRNIIEAGDIDEALTAASAIGDDRLQRQSRGRVVPESFTHGTSEQRRRWFRAGFERGDPDDCDTFAADRL